MRIVVAPDKFRGSLSAVEAAHAIARGVRAAQPDARISLLPVADGGEGTVAAAVAAGFTEQSVEVRGPTGDVLTAVYALRGDVSVVEMAQASGLARSTGGAHAPLTASTFGTGQLVAAALSAGARRIVLGLGGSATTDGGAGLAQALGARLLDARGRDLPVGGAALVDLEHIDVTGLDARLQRAHVTVATDVQNPLVGPSGAAAVYGPQKGATPDDVARLDRGLRRFAEVVHRDLGVDVADIPGAGAAGGLGAGGMVFLGARCVSGIVAVLDLVGFSEVVAGADLVITGEGSMDAQSLYGKAPVGVAAAAASHGVPVAALVGHLALTQEQLRGAGLCCARAVLELEPDVQLAMSRAAPLLARLAEELVHGMFQRDGWARYDECRRSTGRPGS